MVKTKNFYNLGQIFVHPRFLEGKTWAIQGCGTRLGLPLSYSWIQKTLSHQAHNFGYYQLYAAELALL